ncbi:WAT1-related protein isoform X1, partial [Tanacetum coccineum]
MSRILFTRIVRELFDNCPFFQQGCDAVGKAGISALVKCTSAVHQLAYDAVPDALDKYLQISDKTSRDCLMAFCNGVIDLYGEEFFIDCTKWSWAQCPTAYRAQFSRGSNNDINVLRKSPVLNDLKIRKAPEVPFVANDDGKDIYEIIDRDYSPIPIPARRDICNPDELCKTEEFIVVRYPMGLDEEFVTRRPSKISTVERTSGS